MRTDQKTYEAQVLDRLMHNKCLPFTVAREMVNSFKGTINWSRMFGNSPEVCASFVYQKATCDMNDISFTPLPSNFVGADF